MSQANAKIYCVVPRELAGELHALLRRYFRNESAIDVIIERRQGERRGATGLDDAGTGVRLERRHGDRRALGVLTSAPRLPRRGQRHRDRLVFVQRFEPGVQDEEADSDRLIRAHQSGDRDAFALLYLRYFDRIFGYMQLMLKDRHEAEDATQQVFMSAFQSLARFDTTGEVPFHGWLVRVARNQAIDQIRRSSRVVVAEPDRIADWRRESEEERAAISWTLDWISDHELLMLIERLPERQRRLIALRYLLGLTTDEIAHVLDQSPQAVRQTHSRAIRFLADRLTALGHRAAGGERNAHMAVLRQAPVLRSRRFVLTRSALGQRSG